MYTWVVRGFLYSHFKAKEYSYMEPLIGDLFARHGVIWPLSVFVGSVKVA